MKWLYTEDAARISIPSTSSSTDSILLNVWCVYLDLFYFNEILCSRRDTGRRVDCFDADGVDSLLIECRRAHRPPVVVGTGPYTNLSEKSVFPPARLSVVIEHNSSGTFTFLHLVGLE